VQDLDELLGFHGFSDIMDAEQMGTLEESDGVQNCRTVLCFNGEWWRAIAKQNK